MSRPRALDLFCGGGGVSEGLLRAGFDVVGVDLDPARARAYARGPGNPERHERPAVFVQADALAYPLEGFDFVWASPPCQAHSSLRALQPGKAYPDLIPATRERLVAAGIPYTIENVPGAPLAGFLVMLCGTMFGLQTPDGRAELRRHRLFETSWPIALRPACQHGHNTLHVTGHGVQDESAHFRQRAVLTVAGEHPHDPAERHRKRAVAVAGHGARAWNRRAISITGNTAQTNVVRNTVRETFTADDARRAMGIDWMAMRDLSQAVPPAYAEWIGRQALAELGVSP